MKTIFKSILYFSFAGLILTGCAKNDDFSVPNISCTDPVVAANASIADIYSKATKDVAQLNEEGLIISGVVISSDKGGNFHQKLHIVDESTQLPAIISIGISGSNAQFPVGTKINLKMDGLYIHDNFGLLNIGGGIYTSSSGKNKYTAAIPGTAVKKYVSTYCQPVKDFETTYNNVLALKGLNKTDYAGKLVTFTDVQFDRALVGKKLYDSADVDAQGYTLRKVVDSEGNSFDIRTGKYSEDFKDWVITSESGSITGIFDVFQDKIQFYPRTIADINLTKDPFEGSTPTDPETPEEPAEDIKVEPGKFLAFPGADFEDWKTFTSSLNQYGLTFATEAKGKGWKNSTALELKGTPDATAYTFTVADVKIPTDGKKISFLMKGKADKRSISINLYNAAGDYVAYNLESLSTSKTIQRTKTNKEEQFINKYDGDIDTKGEWIKVVLNVDGFDYNTSGKGSIIAFKHGGKTKTITPNYDIVIDEIRFEDGTPVTGGETPTDPEKPTDPENPGEGGENPGEVKDPITVFGKTGSFADFIKIKGALKIIQVDGKSKGSAIDVEGLSKNNADGFSIPNVSIPANAKNIVFYVKGSSTQGGKGNDRGTFVVNTLDETNVIIANYSIGNALNGAKGSITVTGQSGSNNDYVGKIDAKDWVKVVLPLQDDFINKSGKGGFVQFRFAKDGTFNVIIDSISFE